MTSGLALAIVAIVVALSVVQSVFGVGLLVFGTPALLLLGLTFPHTLWCLLPSSIAISALQVTSHRGAFDALRRTFVLYMAPAVLAGTLFVLLVLGEKVNIRPIVGTMLLLTAAIRLLEPLRRRLSAVVASRTPVLVTLTGVVHGLTNLGGGLLTVIVSSLHAEKSEVRRQIAFGYGLMASIQLAVLAATSAAPSPGVVATLPVVAVSSYLLVGRRAFERAPAAVYQLSLTSLIAAFGVVLLLPA